MEVNTIQNTCNAIATIDFGYIVKGTSIKWTFWEKEPSGNEKELVFEINRELNKIHFVKGLTKGWIPIQNHHKFLMALEVDWLYKALPHPELFMFQSPIENLILKRITNPVQLAEYLLGSELSKKVSPVLFYRSVLKNPCFNSWEALKIAILLLMVTDKVQHTLNHIQSVFNRFNQDHDYFLSVINALPNSILIDHFMGDAKVENYLGSLKLKNSFISIERAQLVTLGFFNDYKKLFKIYSKYYNSAIYIDEFCKKAQTVEYMGQLHLPEGFTLINSKQGLKSEGIKMKHCVGRYADLLMERKAFYFHVDAPKQATIEINKVKDANQFYISRAYGVSNEKVPSYIKTKATKFIKSMEAQIFFCHNSAEVKNSKPLNDYQPTLF